MILKQDSPIIITKEKNVTDYLIIELQCPNLGDEKLIQLKTGLDLASFESSELVILSLGYHDGNHVGNHCNHGKHEDEA